MGGQSDCVLISIRRTNVGRDDRVASGHFFTLSTSSGNSHWTKHNSSEIDLSPIVVAKLHNLPPFIFPATLSDHEAGLWHKPCHELNSGRATRSKMPTCATPLLSPKRGRPCATFVFLQTIIRSSILHEPQVEGWPRQEILTCPSQRRRSSNTIVFLKTIKDQENLLHELGTARLAKPRDLSLRNTLLPPTTT